MSKKKWDPRDSLSLLAKSRSSLAKYDQQVALGIPPGPTWSHHRERHLRRPVAVFRRVLGTRRLQARTPRGQRAGGVAEAGVRR
jgi:hypothetical protein